jgi:hypothetical protein
MYRSESISASHPVHLGVVCSGRCGLLVTLGLHITTELPSFINKRQLENCVGLRVCEQYGNLSIARQTVCVTRDCIPNALLHPTWELTVRISNQIL